MVDKVWEDWRSKRSEDRILKEVWRSDSGRRRRRSEINGGGRMKELRSRRSVTSRGARGATVG